MMICQNRICITVKFKTNSMERSKSDKECIYLSFAIILIVCFLFSINVGDIAVIRDGYGKTCTYYPVKHITFRNGTTQSRSYPNITFGTYQEAIEYGKLGNLDGGIA